MRLTLTKDITTRTIRSTKGLRLAELEVSKSGELWDPEAEGMPLELQKMALYRTMISIL